ncbi:MAG: hypothetical protein LBI04_03000 [Treponema sp.]|nr:hypothetical protein [Treponema sp.]
MNEVSSFLPLLVIIVFIVIVVKIVKKEKDEGDDLVYTDYDGFGQRKINKLARVSLSGGLIGALGVNPRYKLETVIEKYNAAGWNCHQIYPHTTRNLFIMLLQVFLLVITLGLWTFGAGYLLLFEKDITDYSQKEED